MLLTWEFDWFYGRWENWRMKLTLTAMVGVLLGFTITTSYHLATDGQYFDELRTEMASFLA